MRWSDRKTDRGGHAAGPPEARSGSARRRARSHVLLALLLAATAFPGLARPVRAAEQAPAGAAPPSLEESLEDLRRAVEEGRFVEAEAAARELLPRMEAGHGRDSLETARVLDLLVRCLWRRGKAGEPETLQLAGRAVAIKRAVFGRDQADVADSLLELAQVFRLRSDFAAARPVFELALGIYEQELGPEAPEVGTALYRFSGLLRVTAEYDRARLLAERAVRILERAPEPEPLRLAAALEGLAVVLADMAGGRAEEFMPLYRRALALREQTLGPDHPAVGNTLHNLGLELWSQGDYEESKLLMERALEIRETAFGPDSEPLVNTLGNYAILLSTMGYSEAFAVWERALEIGRRTAGPESPLVAITAVPYAQAVQRLGDYSRARRLYEEALVSLTTAFGPEHPRVGETLGSLGTLLAEIGDYDQAARLQEQALAIFEAQLVPHHYDLPPTWIALGELHERAGRYGAARECYERALRIHRARRAEWESELDEVSTLEHLAELERRAGRLSRARALFERSQEIRTAVLGAGHLGLAASLVGQARVSADRGDPAAARTLLERALDIQERHLPPRHPSIAATLRDLALASLHGGELERAFAAALQAERGSREHLSLTVRSLAEREGLRYAAVRASSLDLLLSLAADRRATAWAADALDAVIRSRALVLDEMAARHRAVVSETGPEVAGLAAQLVAARRRLANLAAVGPDPAHPEPYRRMMTQARDEKERVERTLAEKSRSFRHEQAAIRTGLAEIASALPTATALVSLVRYDHHRRPGESAGPRPAGDAVPSYLAFVLPGQGARGIEPALVPLGQAQTIDALVAELRSALAGGVGATNSGARRAESLYRTTGEELRRRLWDPLVPYLGAAESVFVVPDGALSLVPFAALPVGESDYLIERPPAVHYLAAERDLLVPAAPPAGEGLLALGDPSFDDAGALGRASWEDAGATGALAEGTERAFRGARSACSDFRSLRFEELPASAREVEELVALWNRSDAAGARPAAVTLIGPAASETAFTRAAGGKRILHLATHGFFLGGRCRSLLDSRGGGAEVEPLLGESPLLLSGLALAGSNHRAAAETGDDGILTAEEVASLDLSATEWAVLSACDSGIGEVTAGEGVLGLRRAFRVAGARTVVMSLWPVDDKATRDWMRALYRHRLIEGLGTREAVRAASLDLLHRRRAAGESTHPFYWAGFVASGDWR